MKKNKLNNEWSIADILTSNSGVFPFRQYLVIPNVFWGFGLNYECDLLVMTKNRVLYDIEIKSSKADFKNDFKKPKTYRLSSRNHEKISYKYYAMPEELITEETMGMLDESCGMIAVYLDRRRAKIIKKAKKKPNTVKVTTQDYEKLLRLCAMRYWGARHKIFKETTNEIKDI